MALREDEPPPDPLACDRSCEVLARKAQLAAAFSVADPDRHVSYFDRHRTPAWTPALLKVALEQPTWVRGVEQLLSAFMEDASAKRTTLPAMNQPQRVGERKRMIDPLNNKLRPFLCLSCFVRRQSLTSCLN